VVCSWYTMITLRHHEHLGWYWSWNFVFPMKLWQHRVSATMELDLYGLTCLIQLCKIMMEVKLRIRFHVCMSTIRVWPSSLVNVNINSPKFLLLMMPFCDEVTQYWNSLLPWLYHLALIAWYENKLTYINYIFIFVQITKRNFAEKFLNHRCDQVVLKYYGRALHYYGMRIY